MQVVHHKYTFNFQLQTLGSAYIPLSLVHQKISKLWHIKYIEIIYSHKSYLSHSFHFTCQVILVRVLVRVKLGILNGWLILKVILIKPFQSQKECEIHYNIFSIVHTYCATQLKDSFPCTLIAKLGYQPSDIYLQETEEKDNFVVSEIFFPLPAFGECHTYLIVMIIIHL